MSSTERRTRVQKVEDWDEARYCITPPRSALDIRLGLLHFRVLAWLGRVNTSSGWAEANMSSFAEALGASRPRLSEAVAQLVAWGYLEKRSQADTRSSFCHYRVRMDPPEEAEPAAADEPPEPAVEPDETTPPFDPAPPAPPADGSASPAAEGGSVPHRAHSPPGGECPPQGTPVSPPGDTGVPSRGHSPLYTRSEIRDLPPPPPSEPAAGRARESRNQFWIDSLRNSGQHPHVVERLLVPLLRSHSVQQLPDPGFVLAQIRDAAAEDSDEVLDEAAAIAIASRRTFPAANQMGEILAKARTARGALIRISARDHPAEWAAWIERDAEVRRTNAWVRKQGERHVYRRFPPVGHGSGLPAPAAGADGASARQAPVGRRGSGTPAHGAAAGRGTATGGQGR